MGYFLVKNKKALFTYFCRFGGENVLYFNSNHGRVNNAK